MVNGRRREQGQKIAPLPEGERGGAGLECNALSSRTKHLRKSVRLDLAERIDRAKGP
jgi:hypothetical protein